MQQPTGHVNLFVSVTEAVLQDATLFLVIRNIGLDWNLTIISLGENCIHRSGKLWKGLHGQVWMRLELSQSS